MTDHVDGPDAERIRLGLDPLQGEQLHDRDDLWRVLERLGHERDDDDVPTTAWEKVHLSCPREGCEGEVFPVDSRVRGLPADPDDLDGSVDLDDPELYAQLSAAESATVPVVVCHDCGRAYEVQFRGLPEPEDESLPEPRIVETADTLHGSPRIDGTRIGVEHVAAFHERGHDAEEIAREVYPRLSEDHVREAIKWTEAHPDRMDELRRERIAQKRKHDLLQSAIDAAVEESLEGLWRAMVRARAGGERDSVRPVGSLLRNGFQNAGGLDLQVDSVEGRVTIDVAEELTDRFEGGDET